MLRSYKCRIYPTQEQREIIAKTFGLCRLAYNLALAIAQESYKQTGKAGKILDYKQAFLLKRPEAVEWAKEVSSLALTQEWNHLKAAFANFFNRLKKGKRASLRFKSRRNDTNSFTIMNVANGLRFQDGKFRVPKLGLVDGKFSRFVKGEIRQCTITQTKSGKYYISILSQEADEVKCANGEKVGIDMTFHGLAVLSTGEKVNAPSWFYAFEKRYRKACRLFSRTVKVSKRHEKARRRLARVCEKVANSRLDFLHKLSRRLANNFQTAVVEDINMQGLARRAHWGKRVNDLGFGLFRQLLGYKMNHLEVADKFYPSSQLCSSCGYKYSGTKDLSVREWDCPSCGAHHDRDVNAAINLKNYCTTATVGIDARGLCGREGVDESLRWTGVEDESRKIVGHRKAENPA